MKTSLIFALIFLVIFPPAPEPVRLRVAHIDAWTLRAPDAPDALLRVRIWTESRPEGYIDARLVPRNGGTLAADGYREFDVLATPDGCSGGPERVRYSGRAPLEIKGVRIYQPDGSFVGRPVD